jgi:S-adenosylmethionine/arginine decarboxylase-like enzyme
MVASINLYGCHPHYIKTPKKIRQFINELCRHIQMKRHGPTLIGRFAEGELEGCSALQFIETSSITTHFDERKSRAFIDIFSCKYFDYKKAEGFSKKFFQAKSSVASYYFRY